MLSTWALCTLLSSIAEKLGKFRRIFRNPREFNKDQKSFKKVSSDSESKVVVAESSAEDIVQRKKVKRSSVWQHFQEDDDTKAECTHCHREFKTKYAYTTGLLRRLKHTRPNISICTRKVIESIQNSSHVQNDTRKTVKRKDMTEGIARMMVLDLRPFDTVKDVNFNELFKLVSQFFSKSQFFQESR